MKKMTRAELLQLDVGNKFILKYDVDGDIVVNTLTQPPPPNHKQGEPGGWIYFNNRYMDPDDEGEQLTELISEDGVWEPTYGDGTTAQLYHIEERHTYDVEVRKMDLIRDIANTPLPQASEKLVRWLEEAREIIIEE